MGYGAVALPVLIAMILLMFTVGKEWEQAFSPSGVEIGCLGGSGGKRRTQVGTAWVSVSKYCRGACWSWCLCSGVPPASGALLHDGAHVPRWRQKRFGVFLADKDQATLRAVISLFLCSRPYHGLL